MNSELPLSAIPGWNVKLNTATPSKSISVKKVFYCFRILFSNFIYTHIYIYIALTIVCVVFEVQDNWSVITNIKSNETVTHILYAAHYVYMFLNANIIVTKSPLNITTITATITINRTATIIRTSLQFFFSVSF